MTVVLSYMVYILQLAHPLIQLIQAHCTTFEVSQTLATTDLLSLLYTVEVERACWHIISNGLHWIQADRNATESNSVTVRNVSGQPALERLCAVETDARIL